MKDKEEASSQGQSPLYDTDLCFASHYSVHLLLQLSGSLLFCRGVGAVTKTKLLY